MKDFMRDFDEVDLGGFMDEMVGELAKEIDEPVAVIISALSREYGIEEAELRRCMKLVGSQFTANNNIVYWDHEEGKWVKRTNHLAKVTKTITRVGNEMKAFEPDADADMIHMVWEQIEAVIGNPDIRDMFGPRIIGEA